MADGNSENLTALPVSSKENQLLEQLRKLTASLTPQDLDATGASSFSERPILPEDEQQILVAILNGDGPKLKKLLSQYDTRRAKNIVQFCGGRFIEMAYWTKQIGITRILVNEYGLDANLLQDDGDPWFFKLFLGCDSTETCQRLIIQFVKEFNINIYKDGNHLTALHFTTLLKLQIVTKFLVEECKIDINCVHEPTGGTALHMAYGMGEKNIAQYLEKHGADQEAVDNCGLKPKEYQFNQNENNYAICSRYFLHKNAIFKKNGSESIFFETLRIGGTKEAVAMELTFEKFPDLKNSVDGGYVHWGPSNASGGFVNQQLLDATPTLRELKCYIEDMASSYYGIGLELHIVNSKLRLIDEDHINCPGPEKKCLRMLDVWLKIDTSASWKKLCDALEKEGLNALSGKIKKAVVTKQP